MISPQLVRCREREAGLPEHASDIKERVKSELNTKRMPHKGSNSSINWQLV